MGCDGRTFARLRPGALARLPFAGRPEATSMRLASNAVRAVAVPPLRKQKSTAADVAAASRSNAAKSKPEGGLRGVGYLVVGTARCEIWCVSVEKQELRPVTRGHATTELAGLAPHPSSPHLYATAGLDSILAVWHAGLRCMVRRELLPAKATCVEWSPAGELLAVGMEDGSWSLHAHLQGVGSALPILKCGHILGRGEPISQVHCLSPLTLVPPFPLHMRFGALPFLGRHVHGRLC